MTSLLSPPLPSPSLEPREHCNASIRLLLHGSEDRALGGPSVRVPRTASALCEIGIPAQASLYRRPSEIAEDTVHLFNVWPPTSALQALRQLKAAGKRVVFSPIYLDFSEMPLWNTLRHRMPSAEARAALRDHFNGRGRQHEIVPGYHAMVREMLALADQVIFLSEREHAALERLGATVSPERASLVHNPVDATRWQESDPKLFREAYLPAGDTIDYVICVGRIEPRKNQLLLARALRSLPVRLALVGHEGDPDYAAQIRQEVGAKLIRPGRLAPGGDMLRSALAGARAFVLPSWSEGASLAALEAAAAGVPLILSDRSSEREYFGDLARYCDPGDPESLRGALRETLADENADVRAKALRNKVTEQFSWQVHAQATAEAYARAAQVPLRAVQRPQWPMQQAKNWAFDVTALTCTDMPRYAQRCVEALTHAFLAREMPPRPIFWCPERRCFLDLPAEFLAPAAAQRYASRAAADHSLPPVTLGAGTALLVSGGAWACDETHLRGLEALKGLSGGALVGLVADAGPCLRPDLFDAAEAEGYAARLYRLAALADHLVTPSSAATAELLRALETAPEAPRPEAISEVPLPPLPVPTDDPDPALTAQFSEHRFALILGPVIPRGNLDMLTRIWARFATEGLHLVIAGGIAPGGEELASRITRDLRLTGRVHLLNVEGADLAWLQRTALFTICASQSESWDWPVTESRALGTPCLASDIPVLRGAETAGVKRLDPDDLPAWQACISAWATSPPAEVAAKSEGSWADTAKALDVVLRRPHPVRLARSLRAGETAPAGVHAPPQALRFGAGWHPAEEGLRWAAEEIARLWIRADAVLRSGQDRVLLHLRLHHALPETRRARLRITCGAETLFDAPVSGASLPRELVCALPAEALEADGCLPLVLEFPVLPIAVEAGGTSETSPRGIGLISARLLDAELSNPLAGVEHSERWSEGRRPQEVDFALESHREAVAPDLHFSPGWGVGSLHSRFALFVPVLPGAGPQNLTLTIRPVARKGAPSGARLYWNGRLLHEAQWQDDQPVVLELALTESDLQAAPAVLEIVPTALATPAELGIGHEEGLAGLGLFDLALRPEISPQSAE